MILALALTSTLLLFFSSRKRFDAKQEDGDDQIPLLNPELVVPRHMPFVRYVLGFLLVVKGAVEIFYLQWLCIVLGTFTITLGVLLSVSHFTPNRVGTLFFGLLAISFADAYELYSSGPSGIMRILMHINFGISLASTLLAMHNWCFYRYSRIEDTFAMEDKKIQPSSEINASIFQLATFRWFTPLVNTGYKSSLTMDDVWDLNPLDKAKLNSMLFDEKKSRYPNTGFIVKLFHSIKLVLFQQCAFAVCGAFVTFSGPFFLNRILDYLQHPSSLPSYMPFIFLLCMFCMSITKSLCDGRTYFLGRRVGTRIRAILIGEIYEKALRRKTNQGAVRDEDGNSIKTTTGEIVNLMAVDAQKCLDYVCYLHMLITTPMQIIICTVALYTFLGWSALCGIMLMVVIIPTQRWLAQIVEDQQNDLMKRTDGRITKMNELLQGIRIVKFFAWERKFEESLLNTREDELKYLRKFLLTVALMMVIYHSIPILVSLLTFVAFAKLAGGTLTATNVFTTISLFYTLRMPLYDVPDQFVRYFETSVSVQRIAKFFTQEEMEPPMESDYIGFKDASFGWKKEESSGEEYGFKLLNLDIRIPENKLTVIIGPTGSGKSSLLSALLGEMHTIQGEYSLPKRSKGVAYVPQQAWLMNATIRENIVFGQDIDLVRYNGTIYDCALSRDLEILDGGDETEIGEKGINLSGGQKQRVALARACYSTKEIVILDDVLSAVDAPTQKHLFENCILGGLSNKTRILVTHSVSLVLPKADHIIVMRDGNVLAQGDLNHIRESLSVDDLSLLDIPTELLSMNYNSTSDSELTELKEQQLLVHKKQKNGTKLVQEEERAVGDVEWQVYWFYISVSGGACIWIFLVLGNLLSQLMNIGQDYWLKTWATAYAVAGLTSDESVHEQSNGKVNVNFYMYSYIAIGIGNIIVQLTFMVVQFLASIKASREIHKRLLQRILRAPISFFDKTPLGRIINRFSRDIQVVDREVSGVLSYYLYNGLGTISILFLISSITPLFMLAVVPVAIIYYYISSYYLKTSRELKRLDSTTRSPIYAQFSETLVGAHVIRAFQSESIFINQNFNKIDTNHRAFFYLWTSNRWLQVRTDFLGAIVVLCSGLAVLLSGNIDAGLAGLSLSYALTFTDSVMWLVRYNAMVEMNLNSVERVQEYMAIEQEAPAIIENARPPSSWPWQGEIRCKDFSIQYNPTSAPVLDKLSFRIFPREKIGIVGRTGAGKSTLAVVHVNLDCVFSIHGG
eukprot:NODE_442_length_8548_cov_0.231862.p1 type:complete len:1245 gc:universal NODE_442_length_8548_cov_0.231862:1465-5199(+)